jgi:hypothetical protein
MKLTRVRAFTVIGIMFLIAVVLATMAILNDRQAYGATPGACRPGQTPVDLTLPTDAAQVRVSVFNASGRDGVGRTAAHGLSDRRFQVLGTASAAPFEGTAMVRYGPRTVGFAWWLRAYYLDDVTASFDPKRTDDSIDLVIGRQGATLGSDYDARHALAEMGAPLLPPNTCDAAKTAA